MEMVSVVMPCYNDGAYIMEAVESVRKQTYPSIELIIIDDGSDDQETLRTLRKLEDQGIKLLHTDHVRPAAARNVGIKAASGVYIMPVDSDDRIECDYIEKAVEKMEENPKIGVVYCHADLFGEKNGKWDLPEYSLNTMLLDNIVFVTALFRKDDWAAVGGFRTNMIHGMEDYDFWLSIIELGKDIYQLPETLFHYRIKPLSRTTRFNEDVSVVKEVYRKIYFQHPKLYERFKKEYAVILRDALIEQIFLNRAYLKSVELFQRLEKIPVVKGIVKRMIMKRGN